MKKIFLVAALSLAILGGLAFSAKQSKADFCGHMSDGGYEPCIPGVAPAGYALVGVGYGSDDRKCTFIIEEARLSAGGLTDRKSITKKCAHGWGDDNLYRPGITQTDMGGGNRYAGGFWWSAKTSGGSGWNGNWNDGFPGDECDYKAYRKIDMQTGKLTGPIISAGSCANRNYYGSGVTVDANGYKRADRLKATFFVDGINDPSTCKDASGNYYQCGAPVIDMPANIPDSQYVITGLHMGLGNDADVRFLQVYPPANSNGDWNGYFDAQPVDSNIPSTMQPGETITKGTDGNQLYVTMKNTGIAWISNVQSAMPGTSVGTCEEDTDADGIMDSPHESSATGASCTVDYKFSSNLTKLSHKDSGFTASPATLPYSKIAKIAKTVQSKRVCTVVDPVDPAGGLRTLWNNIFNSFVKTVFARPIGTLECDFIPTVVTSVNINTSIITDENVTFKFDSLKAPSSNGLFTEYWQMGNSGAAFGAPLIKNIQIGTSTDLYARLIVGQLAYDVADNNPLNDIIQNGGPDGSEMTVSVKNKDNIPWLEIVSSPAANDRILAGGTRTFSFKVKDGSTPNAGDKATIEITAAAASTTKDVYDKVQDVVVTYGTGNNPVCTPGDPSCCDPAKDPACTKCYQTNPNCSYCNNQNDPRCIIGGGGNPTCTISIDPKVVSTTPNTIQTFSVTMTPVNGFNEPADLAFVPDQGITLNNPPAQINPNQKINVQALIGAPASNNPKIIVTSICGKDQNGFNLTSSGSISFTLASSSDGRIEIPPR